MRISDWSSDVCSSDLIIEGLDLNLVTEVVNWEEMRDLQRAFFKAQVPFVDTPQDLALFSALYNFAAKNGFKYIITGGNRSEARRVGKEGVRKCRSRWSPSH